MSRVYTTFIEYIGWVCDDCGEDASKPELIAHHPECNPDDSKRWEQYYGDDPQQEGEG
jgi:hypothetical protein